MIDSTGSMYMNKVMAGMQANLQSSLSSTSSSSDLDDSFKQMLSMAMLSGGSGASGSSGSSMMMPLMMMLMEKLIELQTEMEESAAAAEESHDIESDENWVDPNDPNVGGGRVVTSSRTSSSEGGSDEPHGRPIGGVLTQRFHSGHNGLDFGIPTGTPVQSTMNGKVVYAGWNNQGYGNLVIVENGAYRTYYAHLSEVPVRIGDRVSAGDTIGLSGNTGNSTGPHLHYEIRVNMRAIDPTGQTLG